ncbi:phosphatase PAP2 family protein [Segetibacter sp. 3557_3]|uniref:vanadium-dependent haloperoxidase n=1 Tax=Segetibacter sp. 3557_3 TaxID=2547429 RepID=UPI0010587857|nr:vanadium-dependent haloperoxidase [Segetibacter sp. 3557_3]TDH29079.1 phosphatase PAP2 family protein [Segetibacter sp. 3557_3]
MKMIFLLVFCCVLVTTPVFATKDWRHTTENAAFVHRAIKNVTDIIVFDIYSPPVASRTYAYTTIAGYEAALPANPGYRSFAGQLTGLNPLPVLTSEKPAFSASLSAVTAIVHVAKTMIISEQKLVTAYEQLLKEFEQSGMPKETYQNSIAYGKMVSVHILAWAAKDNYRQTRSLPRYSIIEEPDTWKPTPPAYIKAIEPHWSRIRPFVIDSAQQFTPPPPTKFSTDTSAPFYQEALSVYKAGLKLTPRQEELANFWDCNPFKMNVRGHVLFATKKISPGGHWINITALCSKKAGAGIAQSLEAYASVAIAIADGFISCWDEKYRSNVIRPETYINQYIDPNWQPLLQTPPFPEYTSGHSVISTAAAIMLSRLFGEHFNFTDSSEMEFGLPARKFKSFKDAAAEAAISRYYGGIHYMPAIENGIKEGGQVGTYVSRKLVTRKENSTVTAAMSK